MEAAEELLALEEGGPRRPRGSNQPWRRERVARREMGLAPLLICASAATVSVLGSFLPLIFSK